MPPTKSLNSSGRCRREAHVCFFPLRRLPLIVAVGWWDKLVNSSFALHPNGARSICTGGCTTLTNFVYDCVCVCVVLINTGSRRSACVVYFYSRPPSWSPYRLGRGRELTQGAWSVKYAVRPPVTILVTSSVFHISFREIDETCTIGYKVDETGPN